MNKYLKLIEASTPYAQRMTRLRNRIFGDAVRKTDNSSMRVVNRLREEPIYTRHEIINYYPRLKEMHYLILKLREYGLFRDEHLDFKDETKRVKIAKGKVAPKKRQGKQALNREA